MGENPGRSPLERELDPQSKVTSLLDYDDVVDQDLDERPGNMKGYFAGGCVCEYPLLLCG